MQIMPYLLAVVVVLIIVLVAVGLIWLEKHLARKRSEAMSQTAEMMNFTFVETVPLERAQQLGAFNIFEHGHSKTVRNFMEGQVGSTRLCILDYRYVTGSGKHQHTHFQTLVVIPEGGAGLPEFHLTPENFWHKIGKLFGYEDINFEENPVFSKRYLLRGPQEDRIRQAFVPEVLEYFAENWGWSVEVRDGQFIAYRASNSCNPDKCPEFVADVLRIRSLFPTDPAVES